MEAASGWWPRPGVRCHPQRHRGTSTCGLDAKLRFRSPCFRNRRDPLNHESDFGTASSARAAHPLPYFLMIAFRAMNTDVTVLAPEASTASEAHIAEQVQQVFAESERIFSRFQANSELSRLNQAGGPVTVSANCNAAFTVGYATPRRASEKLTSHW
jgi:hypothetical protein